MSKRGRIILVAVFVLIGLTVLAFLVFPARPDATTQAKIAEVFIYLSTAQGELSKRCDQGTLTVGMTHKSLGFPDPYKPGRFVQDVTVYVDGPKRLVVTATLTDIHLDMLFWQKLTIPAGARIVLIGQCEGGRIVWGLHETGVPSNFLPASYRPAAQTPAN